MVGITLSYVHHYHPSKWQCECFTDRSLVGQQDVVEGDFLAH